MVTGGAGPVAIHLNGGAREVASGSSVGDLVAGLGFDPRTVAVERNGEIVPRDRYDGTVIQPGDRLEVVRFVQGG